MAAAKQGADFLSAASPWVQERVQVLDTVDRRRVRGLAMGPVTPLSADSLEKLRSEIEAAAQRPELVSLRNRILQVPLPADRTALYSWLEESRKKQPQGWILFEFLDAMMWRLERLRTKRL